MINRKTELNKQFKYLQLEETSGFEMPIKNISNHFIQGYGKKVPLGLIGIEDPDMNNDNYLFVGNIVYQHHSSNLDICFLLSAHK